jgi:secreted PhoX family phosphatase
VKNYLSLAASAVLVISMSGCGGVDGTDGVDATNTTAALSVALDFQELSAPVTDSEKMSIRTSSSVTYANGSTDAISFTKLMATADTNNGETFGLLKDHTDTAIAFTDGSPYLCNGTNAVDGSGLDHSSILQKNGRLFMVNQFECGVGGMYGMELEQSTTGTLSVKQNSLKYISQVEGFGGWVHCAGVTTPWNSHLGSEEYEPNARTIETDLNTTTMMTGNGRFDEVTKYFWKDENNTNATSNNNPYYYGYIPEVTVDAGAAAPTFNYTKHFSMGRAAWELAYVMPDEKTAYLSDDGTNVGFYMYIADVAQDLSAGTLYAAKWIQTSADNGGQADILWIKLGHSSDAAIKAIVAAEPKFSDIFDTSAVQVDKTCLTGFTSINTSWGQECLAVKPGKETEAAFLETRRYAAMLGATTEFRKEEGITFNPEDGVLYVAMSEIAKGMENASSSDTGGNNDIRVAKNSCGGVYGLDVVASAYDSQQVLINSAYVAKNMHGVVLGAAASYPAGSAYESYSCSVNGIASPDNVTFLAGKGTLIIGEDTSAHPNDFVWSYDLATKKLTRILSTPYGSETTSPFWHKDVNGYGYLSVVTQHPFGETSASDVEFSLVGAASAGEKESFVGVVGPFKSW